jgi:hypothetical protein
MDEPTTVLNQISFFQNRRDEVPNQELARALAASGNTAGIREIVENLSNKNQNVQSDCLKVLYEIGYLKPELIADYVETFLQLLHHRNNRMVWGAMIALGTIASLKPGEIWQHHKDVVRTTSEGTVITLVWGIKTLAQVAAADPAYGASLFPILLGHLGTCLARDVPTHGKSMLCAVNTENKERFLSALEVRKAEMTPSQQARLKKVIKASQSI